MESKKKYRILGVLVVIAIVVIVMPFVHLRKGDKTENLVNPPPFPSQQVSTQPTTAIEPGLTQNENFENPTTQQQSNDDMANAVKPSIVNDTSDVSQDPVPPVQNQAAVAEPTAPVTSNVAAEPAKNNPAPAPSTNKQAKKPESAKKHNVQAKHENDKAKTKPKHVAHAQNANSSHKIKYPATHMTIQDNGLYDIRKPVWVIQLGSYHSKESAIRMVNSLRANGYKAFFQEMNTVLGEKTNVFVGPELQQGAARQLAKQLQAELKIHGAVISYKPFAL